MGSVGQRAAKLLAIKHFENDSASVQLELGPSGSTKAGAGWQTFFLRPPTLTASDSAAL